MIKRFIKSIDISFWILLAFWLGFKISLAVGILLAWAASFTAVPGLFTIAILFMPALAWTVWVYLNMEKFSQWVTQILRL